MRATVEHSRKSGRADDPKIQIDISQGDDEVILRFRDQGGGILKGEMQNIWEYSYTTVPRQEEAEDFLSVQSRMSMQNATGGVHI